MEEKYLFCHADSPLRSVPIYHIERAVARTGLRHGTKLNPEDDLESAADYIAANNLDEFCWSLYFEPSFLVRLFFSGFLPICVNLGAADDPVYCLLPKLHAERCLLIPPGDVHSSSKTRKRAKKYLFSINSDFEKVMNACIRHHGDRSWLYPPLRNALSDLHARGMNVHSVELWDLETGELAAGEIGYTVGAVYTSMTGFHEKSGSGSVQLAALGKFLTRQGIALWDLGMCMDYKLAMRATAVERKEWLSLLRRYRKTAVEFTLSDRIIASEFFT